MFAAVPSALAISFSLIISIITSAGDGCGRIEGYRTGRCADPIRYEDLQGDAINDGSSDERPRPLIPHKTETPDSVTRRSLLTIPEGHSLFLLLQEVVRPESVPPAEPPLGGA